MNNHTPFNKDAALTQQNEDKICRMKDLTCLIKVWI